MSVHMGNPAAKKKLSGEPELDQDWKDVCSDHFVEQQLKKFEAREFPKRETLEAARQRAKK